VQLNFNLENVFLKEEPKFLSNFLDLKTLSSIVSWKDIEYCMNHPSFYGLELIDNQSNKLPHDTGFYVHHKGMLFDRVLNESFGLIITQYGHHSEHTNRLLDVFEKTFDVNAAIHVYCGFKKSTSFKIHCDAPNNFIIQAKGSCRWKVYNNRMSNLVDFHYSHPAQIDEKDLDCILDVVLQPGDGLYIPPRMYHCALPSDERISMSIPCSPRSRLDKPHVDRNYYSFIGV
jgi:Cupin superfamily protein